MTITLELQDRIIALVDSRRSSIAFAAPEMHDLHWRGLKSDLIELVDEVLEDVGGRVRAGERRRREEVAGWMDEAVDEITGTREEPDNLGLVRGEWVSARLARWAGALRGGADG